MSDGLDKVASRKWLITINNPLEHGFSHERILEILHAIRGKDIYFCLCDETGGNGTYHTHIFLYRPKSSFTAKTINSWFPDCHRDKAIRSPLENRSYVLKDGDKFNKLPDGSYDYTDSKGVRHVGVNHSSSFYENVECPEEHQGVSSNDDIIISLIRDGKSDEDIIDAVPSAFKHLDKIERVRSMIRDKEFASSWRDLSVVYISGPTGIGKSRSVMDKYGFLNVYRVTDYKHPFDTYDGQDVILFEEFRSSLPLADMLNYLDGYPLLLPCRYFNRQACFTKVFIVSNIPITEQFTRSDRESRLAFYRRITQVSEYEPNGFLFNYRSVDDYVHKNDWWISDDSEEVKKLS